ncbi:zinc finger protein 140-like [Eleutherodactylus coqui]|uniref:zinc finger protein 140-like n=1 Tax=Eleutherodactylus coqui TaxID=57060 RepID=UPI003461FB27
MHLTFDDVAVYFSEEEWRNLSRSHKELYKEVMKENYADLLSMGLDIEEPALFNQIEQWEMSDSSKECKTSRLSSHTEMKRPKPQALEGMTYLLIVQSNANYVLPRSGVVTESQILNQAINDSVTPGQKIKLKDCQPICLKCKGVVNCYCSFAKLNSDKPFVCVDCGKRYSQEGYLIAHQRSHFHKQPYKCSFCEKSFKKPHHLKKHLKTHQAIEHKCYTCQAVFQNPSDLKKHKAVHRTPKLCVNCGEKFNSVLKLKLHIKEAHAKLLECTLCHQHFRFKTTLMNHMREHLGNKFYKCHKCEKVYTRLPYLLRHAEVHSKDEDGDGDLQPVSPLMEPEAADGHFSAHSQNTPLSNHDGRADLGWLTEDVSPCVLPLVPVFAVHSAKEQRRNFKKEESLVEEQPKVFSDERLFRCKKCKKCFRHRRTLMKHRLSHSLVLVCHECGQRFEKMLTLFMHRGKHKRMRPYKCKFCERAFSFQSLLHLHQRTHIFSKSFQLPSKETSPNTGECTTQSSHPQHQKLQGMNTTKNPFDGCSHDVHNIRISPVSPNKTLGKRPHQEIACKDYVKRVCYWSCESRYTM